MTNPIKSLCIAFGVATLLASLYGCGQQEGPAEQAGRKIDSAMDDAGQKVESAAGRIQGK